MSDQSVQQSLIPLDADPQETAEWREAFDAVLAAAGPARARFLLDRLAEMARQPSIGWEPVRGTPYINTIPAERQPSFDGDLAIEERLGSIIRWNALAMVVRANQAYGELGGHIASYASAADLFEVGFNHFFRARSESFGGDLVFYQPHSAPGVYARAFLEGRLTETDLAHYRQEITARAKGVQGLCSYPHPWLMPDFWQFPTGSMGIGPISSIYHARFMRYLGHRGMLDATRRPAAAAAPPRGAGAPPRGDDGAAVMGAPAAAEGPPRGAGAPPRGDDGAAVLGAPAAAAGPPQGAGAPPWGDDGAAVSGAPPHRKVWGVFGDGEMDEPESMSALTLAAREGLDNLIWVVNCNLQRLDGPVRGNGRIIDELEALFAGAGWNVIKLVWGSDWDGLFARDTTGALARAFASTVDGQLQTFAAKDGRYNREHFFGQNAELQALAQGLTDEQIDRLKRGGHDLVKIHAAYHAAVRHTGRPTVILAQTKKGYGMGEAGQGRMTTHQQKKLDRNDLVAFRNRFNLPLTDDQAANLEFVKPADDTAEMQYLHARRAALGGQVPTRMAKVAPVKVPPLASFAQFALDAQGKEMSTTMAFVRMLTGLLKDENVGPRVVPIVADEARTFGMANLFKTIGIYSSVGQKYQPEDIGSMLSYREAKDGQILEEGISEAGAVSSWVAAATSYSVHGTPMLPFYIYYSMFGFQRVGDLIWAAADQRSRGFLLGATAGRTTLGGEGLQHQDGHSLVMASTVPNCRAYDPATAAEFAVILHHGMKQMLEEQEDCFYYVTLMNENQAQASLPAEAAQDVIRGLYRIVATAKPAVLRLLGSGTILHEVLRAAELLRDDWGIEAEVWSATSYSELARDARAAERWNRLHPSEAPRISHVEACLGGDAPIVAASDYIRTWPQLIAPYLGARFTALGTDGFGRSDTRSALREFFEVDRHHVVLAALSTLARQGSVPTVACAQAMERYGIVAADEAPWDC